MLAFIIFIIGPILVTLYIIRDEVRRARDKRSGALAKRLPRTEPWEHSASTPSHTQKNSNPFF